MVRYPALFNNSYFVLLKGLKWAPNDEAAKFQYKDPSGSLMMLPSVSLFWLYLVIWIGYFWLFLVIFIRAISLTSCFVHRTSR